MQNINRKNKMIEIYSLILIDLVVVFLSYTLALFIRNIARPYDYDTQIHYMGYLYLALFCVLYSVLVEGNRGFFSRGYYVEFVAVSKYTISILVVWLMVLFVNKQILSVSRLIFFSFGMINILFTYAAHIIFKKYMLIYYKKSSNSDKIMIVTLKSEAEKIVKRLTEGEDWNYQVTSVAVLDCDMTGETIGGIPVIANSENLYETARQVMLDGVFLRLPGYSNVQIEKMILSFENMGIVSHYNFDFEGLASSEKMIENFAGYTVVSYSLKYFDFRRLLIKRAMDILGSIVGLCITAFLTPFVAAAIKIESKGPVFFSQIRIGKNGRRFKIYKFRSMYLDAEERKKELESQNELSGPMFKMENDPRVTKVGKFIRKTSIDELPQFFNILIGQMSLVGTRPPTEDEFEKYSLHYRRRLSITPGLTGMWQVNGRSEVTDFDEVVKYDLEYIDNWSLGLDIKILVQTVVSVLFRKGAK